MTRYITLSLCFLAATALSMSAQSLSFTGTLSSPEDVFEVPFTLSSTSTVTIQTWAFGGGVNANGQTISAGGFDPLIALFSGTGQSATLVTDTSGNPLVDADNLSNPPWAYVANCPSAGLVAIGSNNDCGDDSMQISLAAGSYTLLLSDANYIPAAINDNGSLAEGFTDLTAGVFQTCDPAADACIVPNGEYAVDIKSPGLVYPAVLLTPPLGSTLTASPVTFTWSTGAGVTAYSLTIGDQYKGSGNLYISGTLRNTTSASVAGLPVSGENLYVRLCSLIASAWQCSDYTYAMSGTPTLAALTSPAPGTALSSSSTTFQWSTGSGVTNYILQLGTTGPGSKDLYNGVSTQATSASVTGLPVSGVTIYARLYSQFNGSWANYVDTTYTGAGAALLSPAPGSTISTSNVTFTWSAGSGVSEYSFSVGDLYIGSNNLYSSGTLRKITSAAVANLPVNGEKLYVRLCSYSSSWQCADYNYIASGTPVLAELTSPAPSSVLPGSSVTFQWSSGSGVTNYILQLGTTGKGSKDIYNGASTTTTSVLVTTLPTYGVTIFARLYSQFNGSWANYVDTTYTEYGTPVPAVLLTPTPSSTLTTSSVTFTWSMGGGVTGYTLAVGDLYKGSSNLYASGLLHTTTTPTVTGLPVSGETIYVRLCSLISGLWQCSDSTYTMSGTPVLAALTSPAPGSILPGSSATFQWSKGSGVTNYVLQLGTTGAGSHNLYSGASTVSTSASVTGLPTTGVTVYARLYSQFNGSWANYTDYTYTAQ